MAGICLNKPHTNWQFLLDLLQMAGQFQVIHTNNDINRPEPNRNSTECHQLSPKQKKKPALTVESNLNKHKAAVSAMVQETKEQQIHKKKTTTTTILT